jgi:hypothetical protein
VAVTWAPHEAAFALNTDVENRSCGATVVAKLFVALAVVQLDTCQA